MEDWRAAVRRFLREDVGPGDVTSRAVVDRGTARAVIRAREACVVAGVREASEVFRVLGCRVRPLVRDGARVGRGTAVLAVRGPARGILAGERLGLNFLMRMSGVATATHRIAERAHRANPDVEIAATRKTVPGFRLFDKRAVVLGGGVPHRMGLYDGILVKDNHLRLVDLEAGIRRARRTGRAVEVEAESFEEALRAAEAGADIVMLDNFQPAEARRAYRSLKARWPRVRIEVSGGIREDNVARYARSADVISVGALTHSAKAIDFGLDILPG